MYFLCCTACIKGSNVTWTITVCFIDFVWFCVGVLLHIVGFTLKLHTFILLDVLETQTTDRNIFTLECVL